MTAFDYEYRRVGLRYHAWVFDGLDVVAQRVFWSRKRARRWAKYECHLRRVAEFRIWADTDVRRAA